MWKGNTESGNKAVHSVSEDDRMWLTKEIMKWRN